MTCAIDRPGLLAACVTAGALGLVTCGSASGQQASEPPQAISITRSGSQPSAKASAEYFTGSASVVRLFPANAPARASGGLVTFEPGARTAWHTHPLGQTLIVTKGTGRVQQWGGAVEEIRAGDVVWIPPNQKHWHGAAPDTAMAHIAITEHLDGKTVDWLEKVNDEQYRSGASSPLAGSAPVRDLTPK